MKSAAAAESCVRGSYAIPQQVATSSRIQATVSRPVRRDTVRQVQECPTVSSDLLRNRVQRPATRTQSKLSKQPRICTSHTGHSGQTSARLLRSIRRP